MEEIVYRRVIEPYNVRTEVPDNPKYMVFCDTCDDVRYYNKKKYDVRKNMDIPRCLNCGFFKPVKSYWGDYGKEYVKRGRLTQIQLRGTELKKRCCHVCHKEIQSDMKEHQEKVHNMKFGKGVAVKERNGSSYSPNRENIYSIPLSESADRMGFDINSMLMGLEVEYKKEENLYGSPLTYEEFESIEGI